MTRPIEDCNPSIHIHPYIMSCIHYTDKNNKNIKHLVIIVPIKYMMTEDGGIQITWGCSHGSTCHFEKCRYSKAYQEKTDRQR